MGFREDVQVLATQGFSVLQVNYRGSTGYGSSFEAASGRQWGGDVQKDIVAGTRWAVAQGLAKAGRISITGESFGAYSALQSAVFEPGLFACVVANAGVYDLAMLHRSGDVAAWYGGESYLEQEIGREANELRRYSPVYAVDRLEVPIFIAHGRQDERAPYRHAVALRRALDEHDKRYVWFVQRPEAHGFYDSSTRIEYLTAATSFLRKHMM